MSKLRLIFFLMVLLAIAEMGNTDSENDESAKSKGKPKKGESVKGKSEESESENSNASSGEPHSKIKHPDEDENQPGEPHESGNSADSDEEDLKQGTFAEESDKNKYNKDIHHRHDNNGSCINGDDKCIGYRNYTELQYINERNSKYPKCRKPHIDAPCISMEEICKHKNFTFFSSTAHKNTTGSMNFFCDCRYGNYMMITTEKWENGKHITSTDFFEIHKILGAKDFLLTTTAVNNNGEVYHHLVHMQVLSFSDDGYMAISLCTKNGTNDIDQIYEAGEETSLCKHKNGMEYHCKWCKIGGMISLLHSQYKMTSMTNSKQFC